MNWTLVAAIGVVVPGTFSLQYLPGRPTTIRVIAAGIVVIALVVAAEYAVTMLSANRVEGDGHDVFPSSPDGPSQPRSYIATALKPDPDPAPVFTMATKGVSAPGKCIEVSQSGAQMTGTSSLIEGERLWFLLSEPLTSEGAPRSPRLYVISSTAAILGDAGAWEQKIFQIGDRTTPAGTRYTVLAVTLTEAGSQILENRHRSNGPQVISALLAHHRTLSKQCIQLVFKGLLELDVMSSHHTTARPPLSQLERAARAPLISGFFESSRAARLRAILVACLAQLPIARATHIGVSGPSSVYAP